MLSNLQLEWCLRAQMRLNDPLICYFSLKQRVLLMLHEQMRVVDQLGLNIKLLAANYK